MKIQIQRRWMLSSALGGFCLIVIVAMILQAVDDPTVVGPIPPGPLLPKASQAVIGQPTPMRALDSYAEIVARPVFSQSRKPDAQKVEPDDAAKAGDVKAAPPNLPHYVLIGILVDKDRRIVMLKDPAGIAISVSEGQALGSWTVARVTSDRVVLKYADTVQELTFPDPDPATRGQMPNRVVPASSIPPNHR